MSGPSTAVLQEIGPEVMKKMCRRSEAATGAERLSYSWSLVTLLFRGERANDLFEARITAKLIPPRIEFQLAEALLEHDEYFSLWRSHHIKMVERMVGTKRGTGGSEGVGYLRTTLDKKFFPELWEARTYLDVKHGEGGCPFAKE